MASPDSVLESITGALLAARPDLGVLSDDDLLDHVARLETLGRLVNALRVDGAAELDARSGRDLGDAGLNRRHGCRSGVLLCSFHHHLLHSGDHRLAMIDGLPHLLAPPWFDRDQRWRP